MKVYSIPLFNTFGVNSIIDRADPDDKLLKDRLVFQCKSNNFIRNLWIKNYKNSINIHNEHSSKNSIH